MTFYEAPRIFTLRNVISSLLLGTVLAVSGTTAQAQLNAFVQTLAGAAAQDTEIAEFYRARDFKTVWTGPEDAHRRNLLLTAFSRAQDHGLPVQRYDARALADAFRAARTEGDRGQLEVRMTRAFLDYARDLHSGVLVPGKVDAGIVRKVPARDSKDVLAVLDGGNLQKFLSNLSPKAPAYALLMKAKLQLERSIRDGGWGPQLASASLKPGQAGDDVVALRDRLIAMGYLQRTATRDYDTDIQKAVQQFQMHHGLKPNGIAAEATLSELNVGPEARLRSVIVALERERWLNIDRGSRHIWVNLTDFTAKIIDDGKVTFTNRSVIGKDTPDQRSPEFSDEMELMVVNPSWSVPRSITTKEYLPLLKQNPNAAGHLKILDSKGRVVNRSSVDFTKYTASNFPFSMRQPPSDGNALGLVKFLFPNPYNIYLHDTPSKSLFDREVRAFSHGCIRLSDPFGFAYALLAKQSDDPEGEFKGYLKSGAETGVRLKAPVPVHIVYFTAFPSGKGQMDYRRDIYGRDGRIYDALINAGVVPGGIQG